MPVLSIVIPALLWTLEGPGAVPLAAVAPEPVRVVAQRAEQPSGQTRTAEAPARPERPPVYVPARRGAPERRVPAAVRGGSPPATPVALAPGHVSDTLLAQPELLWHLDVLPREARRVLFILNRGDRIDPVAEIDLGEPARAGVQWVRLADLGVSLELGVEYEWIVVLLDGSDLLDVGTDDPTTRGWIERVTPPPGLAEGASVGELAGRGLWYDALAHTQREIESGPRSELFRSYRAGLLEQGEVELADVEE